MASRPPLTDDTSGHPIEEFIDAVEAYLRDRLEPSESDAYDGSILEEATSHLTLASGAKRARPRLVAHVGREFDLTDDELVPLAAAGELVHTASLLHDDVIDEGTRRRGQESVNARWNNTVAILGGDLLLTTSLDELRRYPRPVTDAAIEVVERMTRALMLEAEAHRSTDLTLDQWRRLATGKTGVLFGWCISAPALCSGNEALAAQLRDCGRRLGVAFQIADDMRDLVDASSGKDRFADLKNGAPSYVLLNAIAEDSSIAERLERLWNSPHPPDLPLDTLVSAIADSGALEQARQQLAEQLDRALEDLGPLRDCTGGQKIIGWAHQLGSTFGAELDDTTS